VCNQVGGTVNGLLCDGTDQVAVHIARDRDGSVSHQLRDHRNIGARVNISDAARCLKPWKLNGGSGSPCCRMRWNSLCVPLVGRRDGTRALMSNKLLANKLGVSVATAERRTRELKEFGYLELAEKGGRRGDGTVTANVYDLSQPITQMMDSDGSQPSPR
jgi:hypothetical protein